MRNTLVDRRKIRRSPAAHLDRQGKGLPPVRRGQRAAAVGNHLVRRARRPVQHVRQRGHRGHRLGPEVPARREADRPDGRGRRRARARPHARRARQDQRPGPHVPPRDGHGAAAHPRGRSRNRPAHRARQARGHQVDLADAARRQEGHRPGRPAAHRRPHHPRAGDLQRRGDHRRAHRRALASRSRSRSTPSARRASRRRSSKRSSAKRRKARRRATSGSTARRRWPAMRARVELSQLHPRDRVHRIGQAPADRRDEGRGRSVKRVQREIEALDRQLNPEEQEAEAEGRGQEELAAPDQGAAAQAQGDDRRRSSRRPTS